MAYSIYCLEASHCVSVQDRDSGHFSLSWCILWRMHTQSPPMSFIAMNKTSPCREEGEHGKGPWDRSKKASGGYLASNAASLHSVFIISQEAWGQESPLNAIMLDEQPSLVWHSPQELPVIITDEAGAVSDLGWMLGGIGSSFLCIKDGVHSVKVLRW